MEEQKLHFDFSKDYVLEDETVLLRPLKMEDLEQLKYICREPEVWAFSTIKADTEADLKNYLAAALEGRAGEKEYPFVVIDKRTNEYAGCTRLYDIDLKQRSLNIGYTWYALRHQGTGLNKHCKYLLFTFVFQHGFERVQFVADLTNRKSIAAMKSIGCTEEGVLRSNLIRLDGSRRDSIILSMLQPEWEQSLAQKLKDKIYPVTGSQL